MSHYRRDMWLEAAAWGAFGGFAMEALDYITAVRRHHRVPWQKILPGDPGPTAHAIATVLRLIVGAGVAAAAARTTPSVSPWLAFGLGAAAPVVLEKLTTLIPLVLRSASQQALAAPNGTAQPVPTSSVNAQAGAPQASSAAARFDPNGAGVPAESQSPMMAPNQLRTEQGQGRS